MLKNITLLSLLALLCSHGLWAQADRPVQILDNYLKANYSNFGLTTTDVANYEISSELVTKHNKVSHVYLQQSHDGIPVFNAILNANILPNGEMLSIGNRFVSNLSQKVNTTTPAITTEQAVIAVLDYFRLDGAVSLSLDKKISDHEYIYHKEGISLEPVRVHLMYQPTPNESVRLVWNVDLYQLDAQHWWQARVDAVSGEIIDYFDQVISCNFDHVAEESCQEERFSTRNNKVHIHQESSDVTSPLLLGGGDNSAYRVFPIPIESPNHGERELVINPADPIASPFGWHDTNGVEGAEYTITRGNTVHAYHDIYNLDESVGGEPDGGDDLYFDFPLDLAFGHPYSELDAATTNLFYWNNITHDFWFHYGFDEAAGNFQQTNYSGVVGASDYVQAEALDGSGTENANFSTPPDGSRPRMQMFLWGGSLPDLTGGGDITIGDFEVLGPEIIAGSYNYVGASFGGTTPEDMPLVSNVVLVDDNFGVSSDGCQPFVNGDEIMGNIAMIDLGACQIGSKALAAQEAGAIAVMICNATSQPFDGSVLVEGTDGGDVTIPVFGVELPACNALKIGLPDLEISIAVETNAPFSIPLPGPTGRDSDFDNAIVVHEYGHGISTRLTGGRLQSGCLTNVEQGGEGWSDFFALVMTTTSANYADEARGMSTYSNGDPVDGGGIRTYPYSRSMFVNPDTYGDIEGLTQVHRIGSVWCVMIWDLYWNLVDEYGFDDDLMLGSGGNNIAMQLVLDGLKLQPCNPTFIEARDAILEADMANNNGDNYCLIWETFARRGVGANAMPGGIENFDLPVNCPAAFYVNKTGTATANAGEILTYELEIANGLTSVVEEATVLDQLPAGTSLVGGSFDCDITEADNQLTIDVGEAAPGSVVTCSYQLETQIFPYSYAAFEDPITNLGGNWETDNPLGDDTWSVRVNNAFTGIISLYVGSVDIVSDQILTLLEPVFLEGPNPGLGFYHKFSFEENVDGGVIEISTDGGNNWEDVGADNFIQNGYNGMLGSSDNPLSGRPAFTNTEENYLRSVVDLTAYTGETVLIRFRLGTNTGGGEREGWYLDDVTLYGNLHTIINTACAIANGESLCSSVVTILNEPSVSTEEVNQNRPMQLFPNPTADQLTVVLPSLINEQVQISILSIDGRELQKQTYNSFLRETLDLGTLPAGVYMLQFRTADSLTTRKVIVE